MLVLATSSIPPVLLVGSLVLLWGALVVAMSLSESYKAVEWSAKTGELGTLIICIGTAISFFGSFSHLQTNNTDTKILSWGLLVLAATTGGGFLASRIKRKKP
jgi:hypothetical protein